MKCGTRQGSMVCILGLATLLLGAGHLLLRGRHVIAYQISPRGFKHTLDKIFRGPAIFASLEDETTQNPIETVATTEEMTSTPAPVDTILREQTRRHQILEEACRRLNISQSAPVDYKHMIVNDAHKILFNFIPKVSCTLWKKVWSKLRTYNRTGETSLERYPAAEKAARVASYRKVLFVRDPMSRILSAYMSKFHAGLAYNKASLQRIWERSFGRDMVKRYRGMNVTTLEGDNWLNITLAEFMRYVTDLGPGYKMTVFSDHWLPQNVITYPCQIKYDFIGHFEDLSVEGPYVLKWLGIDHLVQFPEYHASNAVQSIVDYYKQVPLYLIKKVTDYYELDYKLFGYSPQATINGLMQGLFYDQAEARETN